MTSTIAKRAELPRTRGGRIVADPAALQGVPVAAALLAQLRLKSALARAIQVCAALDRIVQLSIEHATSRVQFGRPLSKVHSDTEPGCDIAAEAALARAATEAAMTAAVASEAVVPLTGHPRCYRGHTGVDSLP